MMRTGWTRRQLLRRSAPLGAASLLSGCGFHPVYMPTASGSAGPAARNMAAVRVAVIPGRPGQLLRQALQQRLGSGSGTLPRYDLAVSYSIGGEGIAINPDSSPSRMRFTGQANWTLSSVNPPHPSLTSGLARAVASMDIFQQQYFAADLQTEQEQRILAREMADRIVEQLAVFFRKRAGMS